MKKLIITAVLAVSVIGTAFANDIRINSAAQQSFKRDFRNVSQVQWQTYGSHTLAIFTQGNELIKAYYNESGNLYGTSRTVNTSDLPVQVKRAFSRNYSTYTVKDAMKFEGLEETAYLLTAENEKETVVLKVVDGALSTYKKIKK